jgi:hypothetical protein
MALGGCGDDNSTKKSVSFDPKVDVLSPAPSRDGASGRILECTKKAANGECLVKTCKTGHDPESPADDCASYAANCIDSGNYWQGTSGGGECRRVL